VLNAAFAIGILDLISQVRLQPFVNMLQKYFIKIYIKTLNYITNSPTWLGAAVPSSGSFDIGFAKVINFKIQNY
jgi:hypothetical protein